LKTIGVKEIPHWGKKSLECESMHVMHYEKGSHVHAHTPTELNTEHGSHHSNKP